MRDFVERWVMLRPPASVSDRQKYIFHGPKRFKFEALNAGLPAPWGV